MSSSVFWLRIVWHRMARLGITAALVAATLALAPALTRAQETRSVEAGKEVSLAKDLASKPTVEKPSVGNTDTRPTKVGEAEKFELFYIAPKPAPSAPVVVNYKVGDKPVTVTVTVTPPKASPEVVERTVLLGTEEKVVQDSKEAITNESISPKEIGTLVVRAVGTDPKLYELVYTAPKDGGGRAVTVTYQLGDGPARTTRITLAENPWGTGYEAAFKLLFAVFVLAVVLEWGLSVIFNYRYFLEYMDAQGAKTVIAVMFSYFLVWKFNLDLTTKLTNTLWLSNYQSDFVTRLISALVLAGGSAGVNSMMVALGFRSVRSVESVQRKPPATEAWLAVKVKGNLAYRADVYLTATPAPPAIGAPAALPPPRGLLCRLSSLPAKDAPRWPFFREKGRFPRSGGFHLKPGTEYILQIQGYDEQGQAISPATVFPAFTPVAGALIDYEATI